MPGVHLAFGQELLGCALGTEVFAIFSRNPLIRPPPVFIAFLSPSHYSYTWGVIHLDTILADPEPCNIDAAAWPSEGRIVMQEACALMTRAIRVGAERTRSHEKSVSLVGANAILQDTIRRKDTIIALLYCRLMDTAPRHRAHYSPQDRSIIMSLAAEKCWSAKEIAAALGIDPSTARLWLHEWRSQPDSTLFTGKCAWNFYDDALKDLVHRISALFPETEIGARTIANHILKAAIATSRSTVQRYLKQPAPRANPIADGSVPKILARDSSTAVSPSEPQSETSGQIESFHVLKPTRINHVWHVDFSTIKVFWFTFWTIVILDGFSRKLLAMKVSAASYTTASSLDVLKATLAQYGAPRFIITDHGSQFRETFAELVRGLSLGIDVVRGPARHPEFNGKVERLFRTLKLWQRVACALCVPNHDCIQRYLDRFRDWYNLHRVHQGIHGRTPEEAWMDVKRLDPVRYFARAVLIPIFIVRRGHFGGDHHLPLFDIRVSAKCKSA